MFGKNYFYRVRFAIRINSDRRVEKLANNYLRSHCNWQRRYLQNHKDRYCCKYCKYMTLFQHGLNDVNQIANVFRKFLDACLEFSYWVEISSLLHAFALGFSMILLFMDFDLTLTAIKTQIRSSSSPIKIPTIIIGPSIFILGLSTNNTFTIFS